LDVGHKKEGHTQAGEVRRPTESMLESAHKVAQRLGLARLPESVLTNFDICRTFLDTGLNHSTPRQIQYAQAIAARLGVRLSDALIKDSLAMSDWIAANRHVMRWR